jgi:hypothetical protein
MNYELAKKLKDNGFKQIGDNQDGYKTTDDGEYVYIPTLSELIEECEPYIVSLEFRVNGTVAKGCMIYEENLTPEKHCLTVGRTPEEAVAKLWLELNEK